MTTEDIVLIIIALVLAVVVFWVLRFLWPLLVVLVIAYVIYKLLKQQ
jgi:predicted PurR-regulated permease PerM